MYQSLHTGAGPVTAYPNAPGVNALSSVISQAENGSATASVGSNLPSSNSDTNPSHHPTSTSAAAPPGTPGAARATAPASSYKTDQASSDPAVASNDSLSNARVTTTLWEDEGTMCYQVEARGVTVARRDDNDMVNGTKLLNVAGMTRGRRDGILKAEKERHVVKIGAMCLKGVWIPLDRARDFARREKIDEILHPLFEKDIRSHAARSRAANELLQGYSPLDNKPRMPNLTSPLDGSSHIRSNSLGHLAQLGFTSHQSHIGPLSQLHRPTGQGQEWKQEPGQPTTDISSLHNSQSSAQYQHLDQARNNPRVWNGSNPMSQIQHPHMQHPSRIPQAQQTQQTQQIQQAQQSQKSQQSDMQQTPQVSQGQPGQPSPQGQDNHANDMQYGQGYVPSQQQQMQQQYPQSAVYPQNYQGYSYIPQWQGYPQGHQQFANGPYSGYTGYSQPYIFNGYEQQSSQVQAASQAQSRSQPQSQTQVQPQVQPQSQTPTQPQQEHPAPDRHASDSNQPPLQYYQAPQYDGQAQYPVMPGYYHAGFPRSSGAQQARKE